MNYFKALSKLNSVNQADILKHYETLNTKEQIELLQGIEKIHLETLKNQQNLIYQINDDKKEIFPLNEAISSENIQDVSNGIRLLQGGEVGCLIVAGGQGTRLGFQGPKGAYPVSSYKNKTLFQIFSEKILAASRFAKKPLLVAIMTSEENDQETKAFFKKHHYFGLDKHQISFFTQKSLPILDFKGNLILETPSKIATGADGNGSSLECFVESGIFEDWKSQGVRFVNYILIDNPLADPFDLKMLSLEANGTEDIIIKCIKREDPKESVGVIARTAKGIEVIEYSEISEEERFKKDELNNLIHLYANISLFLFSMDFIQRITKEKLPLHIAKKQVTKINLIEKTIKTESILGLKFEKFIFDVLPLAKKIKLIEFPRSDCFSPLKNKSGSESLMTVQRDMEIKDYKMIQQITGMEQSILTPFEIAQDFYYPTEDLLKKWKQIKVPNQHYIEP